MIAGLLVDQTGTASFVSPRTRNSLRPRKQGRTSTDLLCCNLANRQLWNGFRHRGLRQYPFCGGEMYSSPAGSIYLRPPATLVETYC